ncbi:TBC1 domain family member 25-like [Rhipicephalus sanguineus]|uniref:TBC1 domain family member 25-like n=1 Tax=Rhipicephalus sanguineus TaxID=34632 RepID=UPI0018940EFD|nr:TBC1 domain family member 25-like [Rhipicephalus sanguineus]
MLNLFRNNRSSKAAAGPSGLRVPLAPDRRVRAQPRYKAAAWLFFLQMEKTLGRFHRVLNLPGLQDSLAGSPSGSATVISLPWTGGNQKQARACPVGDREFRACLDDEGRLLKPQELRLAVYKGGVEPSLRKVVWKHILNVYPEGLTGRERLAYMRRKSDQYFELRAAWKAVVENPAFSGDIQSVSNMVRKDVLRTDRSHPFYEGADDNTNVVSLFNLLTTFALNHPSLSYCQGMSDLASPLLVVMRDEPHAYVCFCALMRRLGPNFDVDGEAMTLKFKHLSDLVEHYDSAFFRYLEKCGAQDLLFCYRWLLLELKREFSFDDALRMLEVQWSSLPPMPPDGELPLFERPYQMDDVLPRGLLSTNGCASTQSSVHVFFTQSPLSAASPTASAECVDVTANVDDDDEGVLKPLTTSVRQELSTELISVRRQPCAETWSDGRGDSADKCVPDAENMPKQNKTSEGSMLQNGGASSSGACTEESGAVPRTNVASSAKMARRRYSADIKLPRPQELGGGNPFMMFLCLAILTQHRDVIMRKGMDYNELAMHFDKLVRQHDLQSVLQRARALYAKYLSLGWGEPLEEHPYV